MLSTSLHPKATAGLCLRAFLSPPGPASSAGGGAGLACWPWWPSLLEGVPSKLVLWPGLVRAALLTACGGHAGPRGPAPRLVKRLLQWSLPGVLVLRSCGSGCIRDTLWEVAWATGLPAHSSCLEPKGQGGGENDWNLHSGDHAGHDGPRQGSSRSHLAGAQFPPSPHPVTTEGTPSPASWAVTAGR